MTPWVPTNDQIVQMSHFAIAWAIMATLRFYGISPVGAMLIAVGWALFKEFAFDLVIEHDTLDASLRDFVWYCAGVAFADFVLQPY